MPETQGSYDLVELALFVKSGSQAQGVLEVQSPDLDAQDFKLRVVNLTQEATGQGRSGKSVSYPDSLSMNKLRVQTKEQGPYKLIVKQLRALLSLNVVTGARSGVLPGAYPNTFFTIDFTFPSYRFTIITGARE